MGIYSNETQNKLKKKLRSVNKNTIFAQPFSVKSKPGKVYKCKREGFLKQG